MRFSKQERIAVLIILAVIILALGAFLIIKPAIEEYNATTKTVESKQKKLDDLNARRANKDPLREQIETAYKEGEHLADMFFPEFASYEADDAFREFIKQVKTNVIVEQVTVGEPTTATLGASFFTPSSVEYALKSYATSGVEATEEEVARATRWRALQSALSESQTIGASEVQFTVTAKTRDDILKFADEVNDYIVKEEGGDTRKAIMISGMDFSYAEVNEKYDALVEKDIAKMDAVGKQALAAEIGGNPPEIPPVPDDGEGQNPEGEAALSEYLFTYSGTLTFYSIERMQDPKKQLDQQDGIETEE